MSKNPIEDGPVGDKLPTPKPPKPHEFTRYEKAIELIDNNVETAIQVFIDGLNDDDKWYRYNCASVLLRKVIPDRKIKEIVGDSKRPISIQFDRREVVLNLVQLLDDMDLNTIKQKAEDGNGRIFELDSGRAPEAEGEMEVEKKD